MEKFKSQDDLFSKLEIYNSSYNNDYLNRNMYLENFDDLYYIDNGDLYILIKNENFFDTFFYIKEQNKLKTRAKLVTEIVGKDIDITPIENVGFKKYLTRVRFRLKNPRPYFSKIVEPIKDFSFVKDGIRSFDNISGNIHSDKRIREDINNNRVIGIIGKGFLQYSVGKFEQTIEHLYVKPEYRAEGVAREILLHYIANYNFKKRSTVWANEGYFVEDLYLSCGFVKDSIKSVVLTL